MTRDTHVTWHEHNVTRADRERLANHSGCVVWFTGLSGCGKSTVANAVDLKLHDRQIRAFLLDGDNIRHGLNSGPAMLSEEHGEEFATRFGLGFGSMDREENIRRIGAVSQLFCAAGIVTLTAFVSPYRKDRELVKHLVVSRGRSDDFIEVFVDTPLSVCESRDPKGLYKKARAGEIKNFTGIDDPYEPPTKPEITLKSDGATPEVLADQVIAHLEAIGKIPKVS
ncbi:MAG: adenylyl-sulfate kinase [Pirellulaceae bacterium]|nr:adenylyl-sulfate kinase [Pirellulaceae bacterium]